MRENSCVPCVTCQKSVLGKGIKYNEGEKAPWFVRLTRLLQRHLCTIVRRLDAIVDAVSALG